MIDSKCFMQFAMNTTPYLCSTMILCEAVTLHQLLLAFN